LLDFTITTNPNSEKDVVNIEEAQKAVLRLQSGLDSELGMDKHKQGEDYCRHAKALQARYKHTDKSGNPDASALKEAIVLAESAIDSLMSGSKELRDAIGLRITLAMQRDSIEKTRESADFAVRVLEEAMESRDIGNLSLFVKLNYCQALRARFLSFGSQHDLQRSAEIAKQLLRDSQKDNPGTYHFEKLSIAALVLKSSYQWLGDIEALDDAITCLHQAVGLKVVKENIEEVEENYMTLAFMLRLRFRRTHASQDIQEAAKLSRRVLQRVEAKKIPDENLFALKNNAAIILEDLYSWSEKENDLEEATNLAESLPNASQNINLANMLLKKFDISSKIEDLDRAVLIARSATEHERYTGPHLVMALSDASDVFQAKYRQSLDPVYLKEAIHYARSSLSQSAETVPWLSENLFYFGHMLLTYSMVSDPDRIQARKQGIEVFEKAWINPCGVPSFRLRAAYKAAQLHWLDGARSSASSLLEDAVEYLMVVAPPWLDYRDRQRLLGKLSGLASDAGACAVHNGKSAYDALKVLESSRGVIMGSTMDWRRDISHVAELEPELEREFNRLRMALDSTPEESGDVRLFRDEDDWLSYRRKEGNMKEEVGTARRQKLHKEMSALCDSIRALPGLEDFMGFPKADAIMKLAERGPVVFVFCSKLVGYGRAIVIRTTGIENVHLPELKTAEAEERLRQMKDDLTHGSLRTYASRNKILRDELIWLWEVAVRPVLESMNSEFEPSKAPPKKPHMQWIGVGILSCVPFHAAGYHSSGSTSNTMSHAISSYTSSLRALQYAMKTRQAIDPLSRLLAVTMKETPGAAPLPSADKELENIEAASVAHKAMPVSELRKPNSNQVLDQLPSHNLVHFACHGVSDAVDPFNSRLLFSDAYSKRYGYSRLYADQRPSTLSVRDLMSNRAPKADLAYLSACSTANMKVATLADESIHIASGFQLAGFRHVVASLWEQKDSVCLDIATRFYQELFRLHSESKDIYEGEWPVAVALHKAISEIREHRPEMVIQWASFIHFGS
jgi:tetratricopeptide (TPR) repeat protein